MDNSAKIESPNFCTLGTSLLGFRGIWSERELLSRWTNQLDTVNIWGITLSSWIGSFINPKVQQNFMIIYSVLKDKKHSFISLANL